MKKTLLRAGEILLALSAAAAALSIIYEAIRLCLSGSMYTPETVSAALYAVRLPACVFIAFACVMTAARLFVPRGEKTAASRLDDRDRQLSGRKPSRKARIAILVVSFVFIILGVINGDFSSVFTKAVNICTECIGLG